MWDKSVFCHADEVFVRMMRYIVVTTFYAGDADILEKWHGTLNFPHPPTDKFPSAEDRTYSNWFRSFHRWKPA